MLIECSACRCIAVLLTIYSEQETQNSGDHSYAILRDFCDSEKFGLFLRQKWRIKWFSEAKLCPILCQLSGGRKTATIKSAVDDGARHVSIALQVASALLLTSITSLVTG